MVKTSALKEVSTNGTRLILSALERFEIPVKPLVAGLAVSEEVLRSLGQRIDWEVWADLMERVEASLGGPEELERFATLAVRGPGTHPFERAAQLFSSPVALYRFNCRWGVPNQYRNMRASCDSLDAGRLAITLSIPASHRGSLPAFRAAVGVLRGLPTLVGLPESTLCSRELSAHHARLVIEPPRSRTLASHARQLTLKWRGLKSIIDQLGAQELELDSQREVLERQLEQQARVEEALRVSEERWRALAENAPGVIVLMSPNGRITSISRAFHGLEPAVLLGQALGDLFAPSERAALEQAIAKVCTGLGVREVPVSVSGPGPLNTCYRCRLGPIGSASGEFAVSAFLTDVTRELEVEHSLRQRETELMHSQKMGALGFLAGGVAHDFNNLLTVIVGVADLLREHPRIGSEQRAELSQIHRAGERAAELTRQLLAFSRREVKNPRVMNLEPAMLGFKDMLQRLIGEDIRLEVRVEPELWNVRLDPGQVEQILINLAVNARDAMPRGGTLSLSAKNVTLDAARSFGGSFVEPGAYVELCVRDTGLGMSADTCARIFEPFYTTKQSDRGTGLGLAMVRSIMQQSFGQVWVESDIGHGSVFRLVFPRAEQALESRAPESRVRAGGGREAILLVEDDAQVRALTRKILEERGYRVIECEGADQALTEAEGKVIELLISDVIMPEINGPELAILLGRTRADLLVLFTSGYGAEELVERGVLDPGVQILAKPFDAQTLCARVRELLDQRSITELRSG